MVDDDVGLKEKPVWLLCLGIKTWPTHNFKNKFHHIPLTFLAKNQYADFSLTLLIFPVFAVTRDDGLTRNVQVDIFGLNDEIYMSTSLYIYISNNHDNNTYERGVYVYYI